MKWSLPKHVFSILPRHPGVHIKCLLVKRYRRNSGKGDCKDNFHSSGFCLHFLYYCTIKNYKSHVMLNLKVLYIHSIFLSFLYYSSFVIKGTSVEFLFFSAFKCSVLGP